jgi:hypothetical protein
MEISRNWSQNWQFLEIQRSLKRSSYRINNYGILKIGCRHLDLPTRPLDPPHEFPLFSQTGDSLLAIACWQNKYETAKMLVELGFDVDSVNQNGSTPLHRACYRNNIELVILLTNHGANYHLRDKVQWSMITSSSP